MKCGKNLMKEGGGAIGFLISVCVYSTAMYRTARKSTNEINNIVQSVLMYKDRFRTY